MGLMSREKLSGAAKIADDVIVAMTTRQIVLIRDIALF
jgi:BarA-like signal transduction histidine kinase